MQTDAKTATEKYGLEAGLFKVFTSKDKSGKSRGQQAKELLQVYGGAYLITSISFAIVSFAVCYGLVSRGDPQSPDSPCMTSFKPVSRIPLQASIG